MPEATPAISRVSRSVFYKLYLICFDRSQHAAAALASLHVQGSTAFQQARELAAKLAEAVANPTYSALVPTLIAVRTL
jgi:hypothetical protein